jgi:hypothetical protein
VQPLDISVRRGNRSGTHHIRLGPEPQHPAAGGWSEMHLDLWVRMEHGRGDEWRWREHVRRQNQLPSH